MRDSNKYEDKKGRGDDGIYSLRNYKDLTPPPPLLWVRNGGMYSKDCLQ